MLILLCTVGCFALVSAESDFMTAALNWAPLKTDHRHWSLRKCVFQTHNVDNGSRRIHSGRTIMIC